MCLISFCYIYIAFEVATCDHKTKEKEKGLIMRPYLISGSGVVPCRGAFHRGSAVVGKDRGSLG